MHFIRLPFVAGIPVVGTLANSEYSDELHQYYEIINCDPSIYQMIQLMLRLHYDPGGHGSHFSRGRGQNGVTVRQLEGSGSTNVARRGRRDKFLNCQKICHGSHGGIDLLYVP